VNPPDLPTPDPSAEDLSQLAHRRVIGLLGFFLPLAVWLLAGVRPTDALRRWSILPSVSEYYYTGAVALFVGVLFALSLFLLTYRGYSDTKADRIVGAFGGIAAVGVALFPTRAPSGLEPPAWWSSPLGTVHYVAAVCLFISFILFSIWLFRKSNIPLRCDRPPEKRRRDDVCLGCGLIMIGCILWAGSSLVTHAPIFLPEAIAIEAFAISWLVKGDAHGAVMRTASRLARRFSSAGD
jgi:cytosine/uracil/thiamine/allantoin permease